MKNTRGKRYCLKLEKIFPLLNLGSRHCLDQTVETLTATKTHLDWNTNLRYSFEMHTSTFFLTWDSARPNRKRRSDIDGVVSRGPGGCWAPWGETPLWGLIQACLIQEDHRWGKSVQRANIAALDWCWLIKISIFFVCPFLKVLRLSISQSFGILLLSVGVVGPDVTLHHKKCFKFVRCFSITCVYNCLFLKISQFCCCWLGLIWSIINVLVLSAVCPKSFYSQCFRILLLSVDVGPLKSWQGCNLSRFFPWERFCRNFKIR